MYFWKTKLVVDDLRKNSIDAKNLKNYYLASSLIITVGFYTALAQPPENLPALAVEAILTIAVSILGLNAAFNANRGPAGTDFLNKIVCISFPLLIKLIVAGLALGIMQEIMGSFGYSQASKEWAQAIFTPVITAVMYWRLAGHIRSTNT